MLVSLDAYGLTVGVDLPDEVADAVLRRLPPAYVRSDKRPQRAWHTFEHNGTWTGHVDGEPLGADPDPLVVAELLLSDLELWVAEYAHRFVFIHAGAVVFNGRAIVLPGRTMSGKTSLTAALVRAGADYFSDEYAVLDENGWVQPYARPLSVRPYDGGQPRWVPVEEFGGQRGAGTAKVGLIAHLRYDRDKPRATRVTAGQAVLLLVDNCVPAQTRPAAVLQATAAAATGAIAVTGTRGDADETAEKLLQLVMSAD